MYIYILYILYPIVLLSRLTKSVKMHVCKYYELINHLFVQNNVIKHKEYINHMSGHQSDSPATEILTTIPTTVLFTRYHQQLL